MRSSRCPITLWRGIVRAVIRTGRRLITMGAKTTMFTKMRFSGESFVDVVGFEVFAGDSRS